MTMADRIAVMDKGKVVQVATPAEIYEAPNSRFVADFVGSINMFEGKVTAADHDAARIADAEGRELSVTNVAGAETGVTVWFAVRPEKIEISRHRPENAVNAIEGEIWDIGYLGDMTIHHVRLDDGRVVKASSINRRRAVEDALTWHDRAWISFPADAGVVLTR